MVRTATPASRGVSAAGRSKTYHRRGLPWIKKKNGGKFPSTKPTARPAEKPAAVPKLYPADDVPKLQQRNNNSKKQTKLKAGLAPGAVVILLAGRFRGKRAVFLKQLESGLLLVAGPYGVNGVPLRRVNQAYVIVTSSSVDVNGVDVSKFNDAYFKKPAKDRTKKDEAGFFNDKEAKSLPASYLEDNKAIDAKLGAAIAKVPQMADYMKSYFGLKAGDKAHAMKF